MSSAKTRMTGFAAVGSLRLLPVVVLAALLAGPVFAGTTTWSGTENGVQASGTGTNIGVLSLTANLVLNDNNLAAGMTTDDWQFAINGPASLGSTFTGDQIDLSKLTFAGTLDSVALYSGTPGSGTLLQTGTLNANGTFAGLTYNLLTPWTGPANFYLEVQSTVASGAVASDTGTLLVAASVPEPATLGLMLAGLSLVGLSTIRRRR